MRASDRAYTALREQIVTWQLPPGSLVSEVELATRLGISRTPVRTALSRLESENLIAPHPGRRLVVTEVSRGVIAQLYEARQGLEQQAARLAARRRDVEIFEGLRQELLNVPELLLRDDAARHDYFDLVRRLDDAMDASTRNPYLVQAIETIRTHMSRIRRFAVSDTARLLDAALEHRQIVEAVIDGDSELAASATHVHLRASLTHVLAGIEDTPLTTPTTPAPESEPDDAPDEEIR